VSTETLAAERVPAVPAGTRLPDFFIVGHPKCGTTALYEMLRRQPLIAMPQPKELRFFGGDMYPPATARGAAGLPGTLAEYLALFAGARPEQRAGEASPLYLCSEVAAGEIARLQPAARIVAILREPAGFLRSLHLQLLQSGLENRRDLRRALAAEPARLRGRRIPRAARGRPRVLRYSEHVRYLEQLRRFHAVFAPEQVLVLIYDDFRADNAGTVRRVLRFLDVEEVAPVAVGEANPSVRVRSHQLDGLVRSVSLGRGPMARAVKAPVKALTPARLRRRALHATWSRVVYGRPGPPDERLVSELRRRFKSEVVALSEYLGRDLVTLWGYDRVD
jgi:hypothetical protein